MCYCTYFLCALCRHSFSRVRGVAHKGQCVFPLPLPMQPRDAPLCSLLPAIAHVASRAFCTACLCCSAARTAALCADGVLVVRAWGRGFRSRGGLTCNPTGASSCCPRTRGSASPCRTF